MSRAESIHATYTILTSVTSISTSVSARNQDTDIKYLQVISVIRTFHPDYEIF